MSVHGHRTTLEKIPVTRRAAFNDYTLKIARECEDEFYHSWKRYRAEHPGSHLQMAVTTKPSKLKPGSKAAKRRKSFCARMSGVQGPMKKPNGKPTRKALALRKWNC
jgi:hypothetical protein